MKNYSDLQDTKLKLTIELELIGNPEFSLSITPSVVTDQRVITGNESIVNQTYYLDLLTPFSIIIGLHNKISTTEYETAIIIKQISVDNIEIMPRYNYLAEYINEHDNNPTSYLGVNGKWTLTIDRPFYQWLHQAQNQGLLLG
jgi:hypothetical protein